MDAVGVLIISPTVEGGGLGRLRCNVDSEGGKYTSASPLCTCLPPRQHCAEVALGAFTTDSSAMFLVKDHTFYVFFAALIQVKPPKLISVRKNDSSYRVNTMGPLCLLQCLPTSWTTIKSCYYVPQADHSQKD